jgi:hypothetical protein
MVSSKSTAAAELNRSSSMFDISQPHGCSGHSVPMRSATPPPTSFQRSGWTRIEAKIRLIMTPKVGFAARASGLASGLALAVRPAGLAEVSGAQGRVP